MTIRELRIRFRLRQNNQDVAEPVKHPDDLAIEQLDMSKPWGVVASYTQEDTCVLVATVEPPDGQYLMSFPDSRPPLRLEPWDFQDQFVHCLSDLYQQGEYDIPACIVGLIVVKGHASRVFGAAR